MEVLIEDLLGTGRSLNVLQMGLRGMAVFVIALVLFRISGRRSFGIGSPLDNIIIILLGAILSRAVVGASPFIPVVATCTIIVLLHRFISWLKAKSISFSKFVEGEKIIVFKDGHFIQSNMNRVQLNKEDVMQEVRKKALTDNLCNIKEIFIERSGHIGIVKKGN
jgi:uncharacterized membrane protein YcaP (DUF421 family)